MRRLTRKFISHSIRAWTGIYNGDERSESREFRTSPRRIFLADSSTRDRSLPPGRSVRRDLLDLAARFGSSQMIGEARR